MARVGRGERFDIGIHRESRPRPLAHGEHAVGAGPGHADLQEERAAHVRGEVEALQWRPLRVLVLARSDEADGAHEERRRRSLSWPITGVRGARVE